MKFFKIFIASILLSSMGLTAAADKNANARMKRLLMHYGKILDIPEAERTHIRPAYRVKARNVPQSDIKAWYDYNGERVDIEFDHRGVIMNLPDRATFDANPRVYTNQPRKNLVLAMRIRPNIPLVERMNAVDLQKSVEQAKLGMKRASGFTALFFKPKLYGFSVEVAAGTSVTLHMKDGTQKPAPLTEINPTLYKTILSNDLLTQLDYVSYSQKPLFMRYYDGKN